eukprot:CAMPEP_0181194304 /NCGR_PEP_ID=MMETSP1096-20121128/14268_1 /TAXON_ID=156174 ORGANISM="Chrysochromulina ericina, Strain CCMP281" /NCGR_SAMPLE_ID=MMETSP1096 /ASSEMBLY_ACC=CAM_ASM_000453 /LENGTH=86 /DNA_ID=CAMNT_0023283803 /DNA_START=773 /DNA_END=1031 /DNA_ORIENTATION=-
MGYETGPGACAQHNHLHTLAHTQLHRPCRCVARLEYIAAAAKPCRREPPSDTAAAPEGSMFSCVMQAAINVDEEREDVQGRRQSRP